MKSILRSSCGVATGVMLWALSAWAGPNAEATVVVDQDATTEEMETVCDHDGIPSTVSVAVWVRDARDLTGFMVRLEYDDSVLKFEKAATVSPGSTQVPFMEKRGGEAAPMLAKADDGVVDIAAGVKGEDVGVDGCGLLAHVTFTRIGDGECAVSLAKAQLSDSELTIDLVAGE